MLGKSRADTCITFSIVKVKEQTLYIDIMNIDDEALMLGRMEYQGVTMGDKKGN